MSVFRAGLALAGAVLLAAASPAVAHQGSPDYLSQVRSVAPALSGLNVSVLNRDDRLAIQNTSGRTVVVEGYSHDPYLRLSGDGAVAVNTRSPAYYLNNDLIAALVAAACLGLALPASGFAHAGIKSYSPKPGSKVARGLSAVRIPSRPGSTTAG